MKEVKVRLKKNPYSVFIGHGLIGKAGVLIKKIAAGKRAIIVSNPKVYGLYGAKLMKSVSGYFKCAKVIIPDGEKYKTIAAVSRIWAACVKAGLDRNSVMIALGGGVIGDTAGFAAATYMRGIDLVQVPTTLLAQADSAIGGKTGIDLKEGKNLAGAFHQPRMVISDTSTLETLTEREFNNGMAEVIKHGIIMDPKLFNFILKNAAAIKSRSKKALQRVVYMNSSDKARIVAADEREKTGLRAILNYGHTIGHAVEAAAGFTGYKHGEAVAMGMVMAARLARDMGMCSQATVDAQIKALNEFNLIKPLRNVKKTDILKRIFSDKKAVDGKIRFVLTKKIGYVNFIKNTDFRLIKKQIESYARYAGNKEGVLYGR